MERDPEGNLYLQDEDERTAADDGIEVLIEQYGADHPETTDEEIDKTPPDELKQLLAASDQVEVDSGDEINFPIVIDSGVASVVMSGLRIVAAEKDPDAYSPDSSNKAREMLDDIGEPVPSSAQ